GHLAETLRGEGHGGDADIVEANQLMAQDPTLLEAAEREALAGASAPDAIARAIEPHAQALAELDDPLLAARAADLHAIARGGGTTAHAAIVARSLGIPLVTGAGPGLLAAGAGDEIGVDADRGMVWLRPDDDTRTRLRDRAARVAERAERDRRERRQPARTADGRTIRLLANAGTEAEVQAALEAGAEGIGLLRSELAFLEAPAWPGEQEHVEALRPMLEQLGHRIATVRTLDFGGDKT